MFQIIQKKICAAVCHLGNFTLSKNNSIPFSFINKTPTMTLYISVVQNDYIKYKFNYSCTKTLQPTRMPNTGTFSISLMYRWSGEGRTMVLTVALALLIGLVLVVGIDVFGLSDPVQVTLQILLQLLLLTQLLEVSASFGLLSFLGELSRVEKESKHT